MMTEKEKAQTYREQEDARLAQIEARKSSIAVQISKRLGKIPGLQSIVVHHLFDNRFRANVIVGKGEGLEHRAIIAKSYYVLDKLIGCNFDPPIEE